MLFFFLAALMLVAVAALLLIGVMAALAAGGMTAVTLTALGHWRNWRWARWTGWILSGLVLAASALCAWAIHYLWGTFWYDRIPW